jgi:hypothetical protein
MSTDALVIYALKSPHNTDTILPTEALSADKQAKVLEMATKKQAKIDEATAKKQAKVLEMATKKQAKIDEATAKKQAKIDEATTKKQAKIDEATAKKQAKIDEATAKKQRKSAEVARKKVLTQLKKIQKQNRLAHEEEEKRLARLAAYEAARVEAQRLDDARRNADRDRRRMIARQDRFITRLRHANAIDNRNESRTQEQLTCATTAFHTDECPICFEHLGETNCMVLRCGHKTCGDCILRHFQNVGGRKCPICRDQYAVRIQGWNAPIPF